MICLKSFNYVNNNFTPYGMRVLALIASFAVHGFAFASFTRETEIDDSFVVSTILSNDVLQGETLVDEGETTSSIAREEIAASARKTTEFEDVNLLPIEPPKVMAPEAEAMATSFKPETKEIGKEEPTEKPVAAKEENKQIDMQQQSASIESFAHRAIGIENGTSRDGGASRAAYAGAVKKLIEKNRKRPPGDRSGAVHMSFVINEQGHIENVQIVNAPQAELAATARAMMSGVVAPSPPGGRFLATVTINFE
jgi:TonB family protein